MITETKKSEENGQKKLTQETNACNAIHVCRKTGGSIPGQKADWS